MRVSKDNTELLMIAGLVGGALYLLYREAKKLSDSTIDTIAEPIANAIIDVTMPGRLKLTGYAFFPANGNRVAMSQLNIDPDSLQFYYLGVRYKIDRREGDDYIVVRV